MPLVFSGSTIVAEGTALDFVFDPSTRDLIESDDGWFVESSDTRTPVLFELEDDFNTWWGEARRGSRLRQMLKSGEPLNPEDVRDELLRCMQLFVSEGMIEDLLVSIDEEDLGNGKRRTVFVIDYTDRLSGTPQSATLIPMGG